MVPARHLYRTGTNVCKFRAGTELNWPSRFSCGDLNGPRWRNMSGVPFFIVCTDPTRPLLIMPYTTTNPLQKLHIITSMQLEAATSPPVSPPGGLNETYASSLIQAHSLHYVKTCLRPQNRKYITYCIVVREGRSHGHINMYRKFCEVLTVVFF